MTYKVIQVQETGEECVAYTCATEDGADSWIDANADQYPESSFHVEPIGSGSPYFAMF